MWKAEYAQCTILVYITYPTLAEGVDECDTAALMYECGKAIVPNLMTDLVNTAELKKGVNFHAYNFYAVSLNHISTYRRNLQSQELWHEHTLTMNASLM